MNYGPDFVSMIWIMMLWLWSGGLLYLLRSLDKEFRSYSRKKSCAVWICFGIAASVGGYRCLSDNSNPEKICYLLLMVYLVVCSVQDALMCMVSDFLQYIGLLGGGILIFFRMPPARIGVSLVLYALIQWIIFMKMYGHADSMAFLICALYLAAEGRDIEGYLIHMAATFVLLAIVQLCRKNISGRGNLKTPVALLPYITVSFLVVI